MKNKYFSQHNSRNTHDASNPTGNTVLLINILGTIIGETLMMLQIPTGNTVPLKNILGTIIGETRVMLQIQQAILYCS